MQDKEMVVSSETEEKMNVETVEQGAEECVFAEEEVFELANMGVESYDGNEPYIFISYSHVDTKQVSEILQMLDSEKFRFWYDDTMEVGEDFRDELKERIESCTAFMLFISKASMQSRYCGMEIITAYKNNKRIYPIYLEENPHIPPALGMMLDNLQHANGWGKTTKNKYLLKMFESLPKETMRALEINGDHLVQCKDGSESIAIPNDIRVINESAFKNCDRLRKISLNEGLEIIRPEAFRGCRQIESITLPQSVRKVGESAFRDCTSMKTLDVRNDNIELGERAFENCTSLTTIKLSAGMTEIYGGVFNSCKSLESVELPRQLTVLGESAFADCVKLKNIYIPENTTKIDDMAFSGCDELEEVHLSNSLVKIGKNAFKECRNLRVINIPASVNSFGVGPFRDCDNLVSINVDPKSKNFKSVDSVLFNKSKSTLICYPPKIDRYEYTIPDSVTVISEWAFCGCNILNRIIIPDSVYEIGEGAFYMCSNLRTMEIPDSVTKIDDTAFRGCFHLETVVIPDSVTEFGWGLFNGCDNITVICPNKSPAATYCDRKRIPHRESMTR